MELVHKPGRMSRRTSRLAFMMTLPTVLIVLAIVVIPLLVTFWISFKPIELGDLRPAEANGRIKVSRSEAAAFDVGTDPLSIEFFVKNTSRQFSVRDVTLTNDIPMGVDVVAWDERCQVDTVIRCQLGDYAPGFKESVFIKVAPNAQFDKASFDAKASKPVMGGKGSNPLIARPFTLENFKDVFDIRGFWTILTTTFVYTLGSTAAALTLGLLAALLLNRPFAGRGLFRGVMLVPYVAPVIAVAFTWIALLDSTSGALNALLLQMGAVDRPVNFFADNALVFSLPGTDIKYNFTLALGTVIAFEGWRYFPLAFLFILARMQSIPQDMYEAADMDGASPFQKFWALTLPQLIGVMSVLFLLRFIWTFNKFDDIFLLTGGSAGTQTLTVEVYRQAFAISNLGGGAAVAVVIFVILAAFSLLYFRSLPKDEGL